MARSKSTPIPIGEGSTIVAGITPTAQQPLS